MDGWMEGKERTCLDVMVGSMSSKGYVYEYDRLIICCIFFLDA